MAASEVAIVGGGWAGLAAAVEAVRAGHRVTLFEAARTLGGRARSLDATLPDGTRVSLDNGQHILDVRGLSIREPLAFESEVNQWPGVVTVGVFAHQKAQVCLLGTSAGVETLEYPG